MMFMWIVLVLKVCNFDEISVLFILFDKLNDMNWYMKSNFEYICISDMII